MTTAGAFETAKDGVTLRPLIRASSAAVLLDRRNQAARSHAADPRRLMVGPAKAPKPPVLAARLFGTLDSAFPDGGAQGPSDADPAQEANAATPTRPAVDSIKRSGKPLNVILAGDADMLMDRNWIQQQSLFGQQWRRPSPTMATS